MIMKANLLLLLSVIVTIGEANRYSDDGECSGEATVKESQLQGLHFFRKQKKDLIRLLNNTRKEVKAVDVIIENMTTPTLSGSTCDANIPRDCCQIKRMYPSAKSGMYTIIDPCDKKRFTTARLTVYCDMETDGGGWIVIQRRNASMGCVEFNRKWADYEDGFGNLDGEFWIGLKNIYEMTNQHDMQLQLSAWNTSGNPIIWKYNNFRISDAGSRYALNRLSSTSGTSGYHPPFRYGPRSNFYFNTFDYSNSYSTNCPHIRQNGWWYYSTNCDEYCNLNGHHNKSDLHGTNHIQERIYWLTSSGHYNYFTNTDMRIRPHSCNL